MEYQILEYHYQKIFELILKSSKLLNLDNFDDYLNYLNLDDRIINKYIQCNIQGEQQFQDNHKSYDQKIQFQQQKQSTKTIYDYIDSLIDGKQINQDQNIYVENIARSQISDFNLQAFENSNSQLQISKENIFFYELSSSILKSNNFKQNSDISSKYQQKSFINSERSSSYQQNAQILKESNSSVSILKSKEQNQDNKQQETKRDKENQQALNTKLQLNEKSNYEHTFSKQQRNEIIKIKRKLNINSQSQQCLLPKDHHMKKNLLQQILTELQYNNCFPQKFLKKGGEADVFKGIYILNGQEIECAIRICQYNKKKQQNQIQNEVNQFNIIRQINKAKNIVQFFDAFSFEIEEYFFSVYILEYCQELQRKNNQNYEFNEICQIIFDLLDGLIELRSNFIIHSDIKFGNILKTANGDYVLNDFGMSQYSVDGKEIQKGFTERYQAPEQKKSNVVSYLSDVYSLGIVFNEICTFFLKRDRPPEQKKTIIEIIKIINKFMIVEEKKRSDAINLVSQFYDKLKQEGKFLQERYKQRISQLQNRLNNQQEMKYLGKFQLEVLLMNLQEQLNQNLEEIIFNQETQNIIQLIINECDIIGLQNYKIQFIQFAIFLYQTQIKIALDQGQFLNFNLFYSISQTLDQIGQLYQSQSNFKMALKNYKQSYKIKIQLFDQNHQQIAQTKLKIGGCYQSVAKMKKALEYKLGSLDMIQKLKPDGNLEVVQTLNSVGSCYYMQQNIQKSFQFHSESLGLAKKFYKNNISPFIAETLSLLASCHRALGDEYKSMECNKECLKMKKKLYDQSSVALTLYSLGINHKNISESEKSLKYFQKSLKIRQKINSQDYHFLAHINDDMAKCYHIQCEFHKSIKHCNLALEKIRLIYPGDHSSTVSFLADLATQYFACRDFSISLDYYLESLEMTIRLMKKQDTTEGIEPEIALLYSNIGNCYLKLGDLNLAKKYYIQSEQMFQIIFSNDQLSISKIKKIKTFSECFKHLPKFYNQNRLCIQNKNLIFAWRIKFLEKKVLLIKQYMKCYQ